MNGLARELRSETVKAREHVLPSTRVSGSCDKTAQKEDQVLGVSLKYTSLALRAAAWSVFVLPRSRLEELM